MSNVAFLFPGQGAQSVGMGKVLCDSLPQVRELYDWAGEVVGYDLAKLCFEGPAEQLDATEFSQPALFVTSLAALEAMKVGQPDVAASVSVAAGLSLGEYTALVFAEAIDFESGLRLVQERGRAMQQASDAVPSGMVSILGLQREQVEQLCDDARDGQILEVANLLCPANIVVSGEQAACQRIARLAEEAGAMRSIPLAVAGAFHTPIMQPARERLAAALADTRIAEPNVPVISNVDAQPHSEPEEIRRLLVEQLVSPVRWEDSMRLLINEGTPAGPVDQFCEIGPGRVLRGLLKRIDRRVLCETIAS